MANSDTYPVLMIDPAPCRYMGVVGSASSSLIEGFTELGTGTATAHSLGVSPAFGARVNVALSGTATGGISLVTSATTETLNAAGNRTITFTGKGDFISLLGVSTTRWLVTGSRGVTFS